MKKKVKKQLKIWIPIAVVALLIIITLTAVLGSSTRVAFLNVESGDVQVNTGKGWTAAKDGMELDIGDAVKTGEGSAVVILYESILVQLEPQTEVTIEELSREHVKLRQDSGSTWNKFASIAGIKTFEVETPTTVATVRGTEFWVDMDSVGVAEGGVDVEMQGKKHEVPAGRKVMLGKGLQDLSPEDVQRAIEKNEVVIRHLKRLREDEINKHPMIYNMVKRLRSWTDSDVRSYMDRMDNGEYDPQELKTRAKVPAKSVDKFAMISSEIQEQKKSLARLQRMRTSGYESQDDPHPEGVAMPRKEPEEMSDPRPEPAMQGDRPEYDPRMQGDKPDYSPVMQGDQPEYVK